MVGSVSAPATASVGAVRATAAEESRSRPRGARAGYSSSPSPSRPARIAWRTMPARKRTRSYSLDALGQEGQAIDDELLDHLSPTLSEHINIHGTLTFDIDAELARRGHRPLRR